MLTATFCFSAVLVHERQFRLGFDPAEFLSELNRPAVGLHRIATPVRPVSELGLPRRRLASGHSPLERSDLRYAAQRLTADQLLLTGSTVFSDLRRDEGRNYGHSVFRAVQYRVGPGHRSFHGPVKRRGQPQHSRRRVHDLLARPLKAQSPQPFTRHC